MLMSLMITIEHVCPHSPPEYRPFLCEHDSKWKLPSEEYQVMFCPFCGAFLPDEAEGLKIAYDKMGINIGGM
jgi:hypothetical protein